MLRWLGKLFMVLNKFQKCELYKHKSEGAKGDGRLGPVHPPKANKGFLKIRGRYQPYEH